MRFSFVFSLIFKNWTFGDDVRSPKVKIKQLGKENVRNMDSRNVLTGNVRKMAAIFDHSVGGEQTTEVFQEKILHFEKFQVKKKTIVDTITQCIRALSPNTNISCVGISQDKLQPKGIDDRLSGPMVGGQRLEGPHPRGMWEGGGAEKRGSHKKSNS